MLFKISAENLPNKYYFLELIVCLLIIDRFDGGLIALGMAAAIWIFIFICICVDSRKYKTFDINSFLKGYDESFSIHKRKN